MHNRLSARCIDSEFDLELEQNKSMDLPYTMQSLLQQNENSDDDGWRDGWAVTYMDILTLLLTLLVLMLAISKGNVNKDATQSTPVTERSKRMIEPSAYIFKASIRSSMDAIQPPSIPSFIYHEQKTVATTEQGNNDQKTTSHLLSPATLNATSPITETPSTLNDSDESLARIENTNVNENANILTAQAETLSRQSLINTFKNRFSDDSIKLHTNNQNINLEILSNVLFAPASATLRTQGKLLLDQLATILTHETPMITVEGHTDNLPISNAKFPSNWELASSRATAVTRYFIENGINSEHLRAVTYGDTHPIASNATKKGRALNRRVSFIIHMPQNTTQP